MTNKGLNLQDVFLNQARKERLPLTIFLTNGYQFKGIIRGFDSFGKTDLHSRRNGTAGGCRVIR